MNCDAILQFVFQACKLEEPPSDTACVLSCVVASSLHVYLSIANQLWHRLWCIVWWFSAVTLAVSQRQVAQCAPGPQGGGGDGATSPEPEQGHALVGQRNLQKFQLFFVCVLLNEMRFETGSHNFTPLRLQVLFIAYLGAGLCRGLDCRQRSRHRRSSNLTAKTS